MKAAKRKADRTVDSPDLPPTTALEARNVNRFTADSSYELATIEGATLNDASASGLRFDSCVLVRIELERASLPNLTLIDVRIEKSSAANGVWKKPLLRRVEMIGSRLTGLMVTEGELSDVLFRECKADFLHLASSRIRDVRFENCVLVEAVFRESTVERAVFTGCDLRNADLTHARLNEVDLRGSKIEGVLLDAAQLRSLTIDPSQAMSIVQMLGAKFT